MACGNKVLITCNGCKGALDISGKGVEEAGYCGLLCQKARWPYHAPACMDGRSRRSLYRAAHLAQLFLFRIRERLWSTCINRVESDGDGNVVLYEAKHPNVKFIPFQNDICQTPQIKEAVLANLTCRCALIYLHCLIMMMLKGGHATPSGKLT